MSDATFERLAAEGRRAVLAGTHEVDVPPIDGAPRFGVSLVLRPDAAAAAFVDELATSALAIAGEQHWATGSAASSHVTIRGLERYRFPIGEDDRAVGRYVSALERATRERGAIRFELGGVLLTPNSVMVRANPRDNGAAQLASALERELGTDARHEANRRRDIWYLSVVHFAGPIDHPAELNEWVNSRADLRLSTATIDGVELVKWHFDGRSMVPLTLASAPLVR